MRKAHFKMRNSKEVFTKYLNIAKMLSNGILDFIYTYF